MNQERKFRLESRQKQLIVFTDRLDEAVLKDVKALAEGYGIKVVAQNCTREFHGFGRKKYDPPLQRRIVIEVPPEQVNISERQIESLETTVNTILEQTPGRCAVYDASNELYYRNGRTVTA